MFINKNIYNSQINPLNLIEKSPLEKIQISGIIVTRREEAIILEKIKERCIALMYDNP